MTLRLEHACVKADTVRQVTVIRFTGCTVSLDEGKLNRIQEEIFALAEEHRKSDLLLDFGNVEYLTSKALDALVRLRNELLVDGRHMAVGNVRSQIRERFTVAGLHKFLNLQLPEQEDEPATRNDRPGFPAGVLIVDDDTAVLCSLSARLRAKGYRVWLAGHGRMGFEIYQRYRDEIALVLLDVLMPGIDGPHTLLALQQVCPTVRCCFMMESPRSYTEECLMLLGAMRVFYKPFAFTEVLDTLNRLAGPSPRHRQDRWIEIP
jgi:anti-anti-sigma factor